MEQELRKIINPRPQNMVWKIAIRKLVDLLLVNVCCIGAVGFY